MTGAVDNIIEGFKVEVINDKAVGTKILELEASSKRCEKDNNTRLDKIEKGQADIMKLLSDFTNFPPKSNLQTETADTQSKSTQILLPLNKAVSSMDTPFTTVSNSTFSYTGTKGISQLSSSPKPVNITPLNATTLRFFRSRYQQSKQSNC